MFSLEYAAMLVHLCGVHKSSVTIHNILVYNFAEEGQEDEDQRNLKIPETEGEHIVGPKIKCSNYTHPL